MSNTSKPLKLDTAIKSIAMSNEMTPIEEYFDLDLESGGRYNSEQLVSVIRAARGLSSYGDQYTYVRKSKSIEPSSGPKFASDRDADGMDNRKHARVSIGGKLAKLQNEILSIEYTAVNQVSPNGWQYLYYDNEIMIGVIELRASPLSINIRAFGDDAFVTKSMEFFKENYPQNGRIIKTLVNGSFGGVNVVDDVLEFGDPDTIAAACHYPYLDAPSETLRKFMASKAKVLVLFGEPGTGKSTYLRGLLSGMPTDTPIYTAASEHIHANPNTINLLKDSPSNAVFIFEDADNFVRKRELGNHMMSELLNLTDGITTSNRKFIFSTNLAKISMVDEALLRPGRCFDQFYFRRLDKEEAEKVYKHHGMEMPAGFKQATLAEILNPAVD